MASIGPQLPPHLQKRKRTPEDDAEPTSPPAKASRRDNEDEIPLDDDSDDGLGPSAPRPTNTNVNDDGTPRPPPVIGPSPHRQIVDSAASAPADRKRTVGPALPPSAAPTNEDEIPLGGDSDDGPAGPAPPPTTAGPAASPPKRVIGPAPPPADLSERPTTGPDSDSSSDDDDDWGPALPTASGGRNSTATPNSALNLASAQEPQPAAPKRDDWMLAPPTSSGYRAPDPTKLRNRKFASGPRAAAAESKPGGVSAIWTETPEEKARRLANAVLGREGPDAPWQSVGAARPSRPETASSNSKVDEARVRSYTEQTRGRSLVKEHQAARSAGKASKGDKWGSKPDEEEDDPSKRAFDWEKDMKIGGRISSSQRRELLNRAANLGGRFQKGSYL
ncbi:hypothetical protein VTK56DRAFT_3823 [Thermocarpiscus australiensis]